VVHEEQRAALGVDQLRRVSKELTGLVSLVYLKASLASLAHLPKVLDHCTGDCVYLQLDGLPTGLFNLPRVLLLPISHVSRLGLVNLGVHHLPPLHLGVLGGNHLGRLLLLVQLFEVGGKPHDCIGLGLPVQGRAAI